MHRKSADHLKVTCYIKRLKIYGLQKYPGGGGGGTGGPKVCVYTWYNESKEHIFNIFIITVSSILFMFFVVNIQMLPPQIGGAYIIG